MPYWTRHKLFWLVVIPLVLASFSNSFTAEWHFDDIPRIVLNPNIHLNSFTGDSLLKTFYSLEESPNKLYRPVANLTLALNWSVGKNNVFGYHLVNLVFHLLTALFLYHTVLLLHRTPALRNAKKQKQAQYISLLVTLMWAVHPMHTQAVTYIVQRMCVMATMFSVLGVFFYVQCRLSTARFTKNTFLLTLVFSFLLAIYSKENAILLPASLFLIELIFFYDPKTWRRHHTTILTICILAIICLFVFLALTNFWQHISILHAYRDRFFTIQERLLTEPRILISYLSQLFYPIPQRLSIAHDIQLSRSLGEPFSTLPAIVLIGFLLVIAIKKIPDNPIFSFAILFFFLNHLIESTIIPLELIFEHRNYLPSLFLFWPLAFFFCTSIPSLFTSRWLAQFIWKPSILILVLLLGVSTFSRNSAWLTDALLWQDAHSKAPGRARPVYYLGVNTEKAGHIKKAIKYYQAALPLTDPSPVRFRSLIYNQIAGLQTYMTDYDKALHSYKKSLELQPDSAFPVYKLAETWFSIGNLQQAEKHLRQLIKEHKDAEKTHALLGKILLQSGRPKEALTELASSLQQVQNQDVAIDFAIALTSLSRYQEAKQVTDQFIFHEKSALLSVELLQMVIQVATKKSLTDRRAYQLLADYPTTAINDNLLRFTRFGISPDEIQPVRLFLTEAMNYKITTLF